MKRMLAYLVIAALVLASLVACTPKPKDPVPTLEAFLSAAHKGEWKTAKKYVDRPDEAQSMFERTSKGLQSEGLDITVHHVHLNGTNSTIDFAASWQLPGGRHFEYSTSARLSQYKGSWLLRWEPRLLHPQLGAGQHLELRALPAQRASVLSSDGKAVLTPGIQRRVLVNADALSGQAAQSIATKLQVAFDNARGADPTVPTIDRAELVENLQKAKGLYSVAVLREQAGGLVARNLEGTSNVTVNEEAALVTPDPGFAPDIMSRVRSIVGDDLQGSAGWQVAIVNPEGNALGEVARQDADVARAARISIDYSVQRAAQDAVNRQQGRKAMIVAIRPSTGEILAVAQSPEADKDGDVALMGLFPPGSTFKVITAAAGFEDSGLNPDTPVPCPGTMNIYGRVVTNYNTFALGTTPLRNAFAQSCNTTFADISTKLQPGQLADVARQFGIGLDYKIPGLDTVTGQVPHGQTPLERTEAGYGQGLDLVSPFGVALMSATAAAGKLPTPVLVQGHPATASQNPPALSQATIDKLREVMRAVVTSGSGRGSTVPGELFAKTGEAEINEGSHSWFTGYRDDIAFASLIVLGGGSERAVAMTNDFFHELDALRAGIAVG